MRKSVLVIAVTAAACSGVAFAGEVKQDQKALAPVVKATTMSDAQMDKVTAGGWAFGQADGKGWEAPGFDTHAKGKAMGLTK